MNVSPYLRYLAIAGLLHMPSCADDTTAEEPILEDVDTSVYPDDPAMEDPIGDMDSFADTDETDDGIGELTDEPFSETARSGDFATPGEDDSEDTAPSDSDMAEMYTDSFEDEPGYDMTEPLEGEANIPDSIVDSVAQGDEQNYGADDGFSNYDGGQGEQVRYVDALLLNVRSSPSLKAPIVRRLLGGAKISVTIEGAFAKIRDGQYVSAKYLSSSPTRKVSRREVTNAWKRSRYKDTWVPPR